MTIEIVKSWFYISSVIFVFGALMSPKREGDNLFKDLYRSFSVTPLLIIWPIWLLIKYIYDLAVFDPYNQQEDSHEKN